MSKIGAIQASTRRIRSPLLVRLLAVVVLAGTFVGTDAGADEPRDESPDRGYSAGSTLAEHENFASARSMTTAAPAGTPGIDVSNWQRDIDWAAVAADDIKFAYIKATGGSGFVDQWFDQNYAGAYEHGIIRGAYHFARPDQSSPVQQARFFVHNGGGWSSDGMTLPPMLDMEYNPSGSDCYGLSHSQMVDWIRGFSNEVNRLTGRYPVIYTTTNWWTMCTGNTGAFNDTNPLFIANWGSDPYPLPNWPVHTFWQYTSSGYVAGIRGEVDRDVFNGSYAQLKALATDSPISEHYGALGGADSFLGEPTSAVYDVAGGKARNYQGGRIYYSPTTGAHDVHGAILARYLELGGPSFLGLPVTGERGTPDGVGRYNHFTGLGGASIYWTPATGAHEVYGAIRNKWESLGWERSALGYPTSGEQDTSNGTGRVNTFAGRGGAAIYWTSETGAHEVHGKIYEHYTDLGGTSFLGFPTTDEQPTPDGVGRYNHFSGKYGASIYWTGRTGAWATYGAIRRKWASLGWEQSRLGYPTSNEYAISGGRGNDYEHGSIYWYSDTGTIRIDRR